MIPVGLPVADIGTDHGRLPAWLLRNGRVPRVIATDRAAGPLQGAQQRLRGLSVDLRLGDGLHTLDSGEVETVVLAGMGGRRVVRILQSCPEITASLTCVVVQPQGEAEWLRRYFIDWKWRLFE